MYSWKLSRTNTLTPEAENAINETSSQVNVLDSRYYAAVNRSEESCFYFPAPNGKPVVFRGQCDQTIDVVMNFNASGVSLLFYSMRNDLKVVIRFDKSCFCFSKLHRWLFEHCVTKISITFINVNAMQ